MKTNQFASILSSLGLLTSLMLASSSFAQATREPMPPMPERRAEAMEHAKQRMERMEGKEHPGRMGGAHGGEGEMMGRHLDHMAKAVNATPEQKAKLEAIAKAAHTDIKPLHDQLRAGRERGMALFAAPNLDRAAIEQHRAQQAQIMDLISKRRTQARLDAAAVLSPEQRAQLASKMKDMQGKMPMRRPGGEREQR